MQNIEIAHAYLNGSVVTVVTMLTQNRSMKNNSKHSLSQLLPLMLQCFEMAFQHLHLLSGLVIVTFLHFLRPKKEQFKGAMHLFVTLLLFFFFYATFSHSLNGFDLFLTPMNFLSMLCLDSRWQWFFTVRLISPFHCPEWVKHHEDLCHRTIEFSCCCQTK